MRLPPAGTIEIAPSILSADFGQLASEIAQVEAAGVSIVHLDVMDGHFVPNLTIGPPVIAKLRRHSDLVFDSHTWVGDEGTLPIPFTMEDLNPGVEYQVQIIAAVDGRSCCLDRTQTFQDTADGLGNVSDPLGRSSRLLAPWGIRDRRDARSCAPGGGEQSGHAHHQATTQGEQRSGTAACRVFASARSLSLCPHHNLLAVAG